MSAKRVLPVLTQQQLRSIYDHGFLIVEKEKEQQVHVKHTCSCHRFFPFKEKSPGFLLKFGHQISKTRCCVCLTREYIANTMLNAAKFVSKNPPTRKKEK